MAGQLILSEVYYDHVGSDNGYEWVEIANVGTTTVDLSTWSLGWGGSDYTYGTLQLSGTIAPGATFVVGGPISDPVNANPTYDLAIDFDPDIQNGGASADGIALFDVVAEDIKAASIPVDAVIYAGTNTNNLLDETGNPGATDVADVTNGWSIQRIDLEGTWAQNEFPSPGTLAFGLGSDTLLLSEVFYDPVGTGDDGLEWVEIINPGSTAVDLSSWSLGWGGLNLVYGQLQLSGTIAAGATIVVGGPVSSAANQNPSFDLAVDLNPDLQNSGAAADAVALFNLPASSVSASTVPVDVVIYGGTNSNNLIDETGAIGTVDVGDAASGQSIVRINLAGAWQIQNTPTPGIAAFAFGDPVTGVRILSVNTTTGTVQLEITLATAASVDIESSGNLAPSSWQPESTVALPAGTTTVSVTLSPVPDRAFLRVLESGP
ncbi:endonuclease [Haloferula helveola]|uniref:Endonuclease n=1 Tax=Haloferula helveola TaxID=490095 RepID=A0ABM7RDV0_9BACT|nr:endonuclease [Haloferula helveola]